MRSLVDQTLFRVDSAPYSVLVIDDGSCDDSFAVAMRVADEYPTLFTVVRQENKGAASARNKGIELCDAPYLMFVDNDDYVDSDYIEAYLAKAKTSGSDIVVGGYRRENKNQRVSRRVTLADSEWSRYRNVAPWGKIYRTELLKENDIRFFDNNIGEDTVFTLRAYAAANSITLIDNCGYVWYENEESVSNTVQKGLRKECNIVGMLDTVRATIPRGDVLGEYFIFRYVVWYILFSGQSASADRFEEETNNLFGWLEDNGVRLSLHAFSREIASDPLGFRLAVACVALMRRVGLTKFFARFYCRLE